MNHIYTISDGRKAAFYEEGNRLMLYLFPMRRGNFPLVIREDYLSGLTSIMFHGDIHYAYRNLEHRIVFGNVNGNGEMIVAAEGGSTGKLLNLTLLTAGEELGLLYMAEDKDANRRRLELVFPYYDKEPWTLAAGTKQFSYICMQGAKERILLLREGERTVGRMEWRDGAFRPVMPMEEIQEDMENSIRKEFERWREEYQKETDAREARLQREWEQKMEEQSALLAAAEKKTGKYEEILREYERRMEAAGKQYAELAEVTRKLQEAGRRWRGI